VLRRTLALRIIRPPGIWLIAAACALVGCGGSIVRSSSQQDGVSFTGKLMSGQQAIANAAIEMYAAGSTGYGTGASSLLNSSVDTAEDGSFSIGSDYACPSDSSQIYLVAKGGNAGQNAVNSQIVLLAAIGPCSGISSSTVVTINEVSTVAAVYALAGFLGSNAEIGATSTNSQGLQNAFANVLNLVDPAMGTSPGSAAPTGAIVPSSKLNTLAGILSKCVSSATNSACSSLFSAATPAYGSMPSNTLDALLNIVRNPASNAAALFALAPATWPFKPVLSATPKDWTLAISYTGGGLNGPTAIALDSAGSIWAANYYDTLTKLSSTGTAFSSSAGYTGGGLQESYGLTVDNKDNVWVSNEESPYAVNSGHGTVTELSSSGQFLSGASGYYQGGLSFPDALAADTNGDIWVANDGDSSGTLLSSSGSSLSGTSGYGSGSMAFPAAVVVDGNHNAWFANQSSTTITEISLDGSVVKSVSCCDGASGIAVDQYNNVWVANYFGNSVSQVTTSGTVVSSGYTASSVNHPSGIAIDGAGNIWITNFQGNSIDEIYGAGSGQVGTVAAPLNGYGTDTGLNGPFGIAVDASGNVWVSNFGGNTLIIFVGLAAPTRTPAVGIPDAP